MHIQFGVFYSDGGVREDRFRRGKKKEIYIKIHYQTKFHPINRFGNKMPEKKRQKNAPKLRIQNKYHQKHPMMNNTENRTQNTLNRQYDDIFSL